MRRSALVALALMSLAACGHRTGRIAPPDRNRIDADEIAASSASTAYEIVERLRPAFLRTRGSQSIQNPVPVSPVVYVDGMRYGPVESLFRIPALGIVSIEYLNAIDASQRFGMGNEGGAILITTRH